MPRGHSLMASHATPINLIAGSTSAKKGTVRIAEIDGDEGPPRPREGTAGDGEAKQSFSV